MGTRIDLKFAVLLNCVLNKSEQRATHLAVVSPQVEVYSLRRCPLPSAMARGERHSNDTPAIPRGEPAFFIVALPTHRLLLLALRHASFPGQAEDVRVAAEHGPMLDRREHSCRQQTVFHCSGWARWSTSLVPRHFKSVSVRYEQLLTLRVFIAQRPLPLSQ